MKNHIGSLVLNSTLAGLMTLMVVACNKPTQPSGPVPLGTTVGTEIDDTVITAAIKSAFLANSEVRSFDLQVETRKGEVQLSGFVKDSADINRAIEVTKGVAGVKSVKNDMRLK